MMFPLFKPNPIFNKDLSAKTMLTPLKPNPDRNRDLAAKKTRFYTLNTKPRAKQDLSGRKNRRRGFTPLKPNPAGNGALAATKINKVFTPLKPKPALTRAAAARKTTPWFYTLKTKPRAQRGRSGQKKPTPSGKYTLKRERGSRRAARALISSEGRVITRARRLITGPRENGAVGGGV